MRKLTWFSITLLTVLLVSGSASAQSIWLGIHGGLSIPDLSGGGGNALSSDYTSRLAGNFGFQSDFGITKKFSIAVELNYAGQGGKRDGMQPITNLRLNIRVRCLPATICMEILKMLQPSTTWSCLYWRD